MPNSSLLHISSLRRMAANPGQVFGRSAHFYSRYGVAISIVLAALVLIGVGKIIFGSAPLVLLALAIVTASRVVGIGGGIFSVLVSTLAADFFFLPPLLAVNLDQATWILGAKYSAVALLSYAVFRQGRRRPVPLEKLPPLMLGALGHLDGIQDCEIYGWAINPDTPNKPAKITAHVNGRPVVEALAVYYRPDVAEQFKCSGQHGFYLDLSQVSDADTDAIIDVRLSNGRSLQNAPIRAHLTRCRRSRKPTLLYMHIAKTAGTALRETILNNYKQSEVAYIYPEPPGFPVGDLRDLPLAQRAQFRFVVGHFQYGIHNEIPNEYSYFSVVRNPLYRVRSHYNYLVEYKNPLVASDKHIKTLEEVLEGGLTVDLDNLMVRCFAGVNEKHFPPGTINGEIYELARHHAEKEFLYIGQQERLREAYLFLQEKLGWNWSLPPEMMNRGSYSREDRLVDSDAELIQRFNSWDFKLYEHILEIFP
ncbi:MAG: DUF4118 domain-containing protein [Bryobacteraceae bacterium]